MKIGIEGQRLYRKKKHGMDIVALEMIYNLQQIDRENEYVVFVKPDEDDTIFEEKTNWKIVEVPGYSYPSWEQFSLPRAAKKESVDILHCTSDTAPIFQSMPLILTLHDVIYLEKNKAINKNRNWYQRLGNKYRQFNVPMVAPKCWSIITVSHFEKKQIEDMLKLPEEKIQVVYNGVSTHFQPINDKQKLMETQNRYNLPDEFLLFFGNTDPKKNMRRVLEAYAMYLQSSRENIPLLLLDYDESVLTNDLKELGQPGLRENIILPGYIKNSDLPAIFNLCTLFLYPSLRESFGIPILEAMASGVPVITSNSSSMPEVSGDAAFLVDPTDSYSIVNGIQEILSNDSLRFKMIKNGFKQAKKFTWRKTAEQVLEIYENFKRNNLV